MLRNFRYDEIKGCEPQNGSHALIPLLILCHFTSLHKMRRRAKFSGVDMQRAVFAIEGINIGIKIPVVDGVMYLGVLEDIDSVGVVLPFGGIFHI